MTIALEKPAASNVAPSPEMTPLSPQTSRDVGGTALKAINTGTTALMQHEGVSNQELSGSMDKITNVIYKMQDDPNFLRICEQRNIDPIDGMNTADYWHTFGSFAKERIAGMREKGANGIAIDLLELAAVTPAHTYNQGYLDSLQPLIKKGGFKSLSPEQRSRYDTALRQASTFNGSVRNFAEQWNPVAASLHGNLTKMVPMSVEKAGRDSASQRIAACIRGAQHELGFSQILTSVGIAHREAAMEEDIKGKDIIITEPGYPVLDIDVKASLSEIEAKGGENKAFARDVRGTYKVYSLIKDKEFAEGRFRLSDDACDDKAAFIPALLTDIRSAA